MSPPPPLHWRPSIARRVLQDTTVVWAARRRLVRSRIAARPPVAALVHVVWAARSRQVRSRILFDCASWPAPLQPLLFVSSGRREGDTFNCASCLIARRGRPPCRRSFSRRPGGAKETRSIARRGTPPPSPLLFALSGQREGDWFDRASRPDPPLPLLF